MKMSGKSFRTCKFILANINNFENKVGVSLRSEAELPEVKLKLAKAIIDSFSCD